MATWFGVNEIACLCEGVGQNMLRSILKKTIPLMVGSVLFSQVFAERAVLLVSLGMPNNTLKLYLTQAKQYHIPVVIRGLYTQKDHKNAKPFVGSFKDTVSRVQSLVKDSNTGGVSINPLLFRAFGIKVVPALVVYNEGRACLDWASHATGPTCDKDEFDVVYGNQPIKTLLKRISEDYDEGHRADYANFLLSQYGEVKNEAL